jgi:uncharacterized protein
MSAVFADISMTYVLFALAFGLLAGFVKGAVGFALPLILISSLSTFLPPEDALAVLVIPTLVANLWQAARGGFAPLKLVFRKFRRFLAVLLAGILIGAQFIPYFSEQVMFLLIGGPVVAFSLVQLAGFKFSVPDGRKGVVEVVLGSAAGVIGGVTGVWGPPTIAYLTALDTPKKVQIQTIGVIFGSGAVMLLLSHLQSGVLNARTLPWSLMMVGPVIAGMALGVLVQDRLDPVKFRRITLIVLALAGLNLLRRGLMG